MWCWKLFDLGYFVEQCGFKMKTNPFCTYQAGTAFPIASTIMQALWQHCLLVLDEANLSADQNDPCSGECSSSVQCSAQCVILVVVELVVCKSIAGTSVVC